MFSESRIDQDVDQCGGSRNQRVIINPPKLVSSQEQPNASQSLTVLVDSKEISNPEVSVYNFIPLVCALQLLKN